MYTSMSELKNTSSQRLSKQNTSCRHQSGECERHIAGGTPHVAANLFQENNFIMFVVSRGGGEARVTQCNNIIKTPASGLKPNY